MGRMSGGENNLNIDWFIKSISDTLYEVFDPEEKNDAKVDAALDRIANTVIAVIKDPEIMKDLLKYYGPTDQEDNGITGLKAE